MPRLYYLGSLRPDTVKQFPIHAGDRVVMVKNQIGEYIDLTMDEQVEDVLRTHRLITKQGEFPAFTRDIRQVRQAMAAIEKRRNPQPAPVQQANLSRADLLRMLAELPEESEIHDEDSGLLEEAGVGVANG